MRRREGGGGGGRGYPSNSAFVHSHPHSLHFTPTLHLFYWMEWVTTRIWESFNPCFPQFPVIDRTLIHYPKIEWLKRILKLSFEWLFISYVVKFSGAFKCSSKVFTLIDSIRYSNCANESSHWFTQLGATKPTFPLLSTFPLFPLPRYFLEKIQPPPSNPIWTTLYLEHGMYVPSSLCIWSLFLWSLLESISL